NVHIYGTLHEPVHAANLEQAIKNVSATYRNPYIIAIDASLGQRNHIGYITLGTGPLKPGLGVQKKLPEVGDIHITGIVNTFGNMNNVLLQTTRLSYIMTIADAVSTAIINTMCSLERLSVYPYMQPSPDQPFQQYRIS
ncbi:MAG: spore protease YyaC, partial [Lachnospira sp.]|nr:spore protease YyaC [Lachnospira sp.]